VIVKKEHGLRAILIFLLCAVSTAAGAYENFKVAIYVTVSATRQLADPQTLQRQYDRIASQVRFDKVYIETYRSGQFADEAALAAIGKFFRDRGIAVSGGITLAAAGHAGQFGTFDYENPQDRAECQRAVELTARHFDEIILDDFFFYTTKSDADIAAKGQRSWTQYRLEKMREVAENLVLKPARTVNPRVKMTIKYPNWYEHFQALGYDLDVEAKKFDFIYTGTETRDPDSTDQFLQQYESYLIVRYFDNIRPNGGNRGGWVDTFATKYVDRYPEQLWDTLFAKAPEITLFSWSQLASPDAVAAGDRDAWRGQRTSFNWDEMVSSFEAPRKGHAAPGSGRGAPKLERAAPSPGHAAPGWGRVAGYSLEQVDSVLGRLGNPIGIASYKPYQSSGEDFLQEYLGNLGIPIELMPQFPTQAGIVLLTEAAKGDADIVAKIKAQLVAGKSVVITSGLLRALQGSGIEDVVELEYTGRKIAVQDYAGSYGAGSGLSLNDSSEQRGVVFPEIRFYTNDSWPVVRGVAHSHGVPILLMNRYSRGILYVLNIPDNVGDLYRLPQAVTSAIKGYLLADFPVRLDAPAGVSLFVYDNGTFIVQSFRPEASAVEVSIPGTPKRVRDLQSNEAIDARSAPASRPHRTDTDSVPRTRFALQIPAHSYRALAIEK
jgi:hypothetical protein